MKAIALALVLLFSSENLAYAQESAPLWTQVAQVKSSGSPGKSEEKLSNITIPYGSGVARKIVVKGSDDVIINIQDAHSKLGAQESIVKILDNLVKNYNLNLIAVEGSVDAIDTSVVSSFPIEEVRKKTATYLMKEGKISAAEFYSMVSQEPVKLYGVDDAKLHTENTEVFKAIVENKLAVRKELKGLKYAIQELETKVYSPALSELTRHRLLHKNGDIKFTDYWNYFVKVAGENGVDYQKYPNLKKLSDTVGLEKEIDFKKASVEREALMNEINQRLQKDDLEKLVLQALQYKQNKLSAGKFHLTLAELSQKAGIDPLVYKNIILYSQYVVMYENIDLISIFQETESFENDVKEKLFCNQDERTLSSLTRCVNILTQLLDTSLTSKEYEYFMANQSSCQINEIQNTLQTLGEKYKVPYQSYTDFSVLEKSIPDAMKFYELATKRNQALMQNTMERMKKENVHVAALVTGGFHSEGISALMDQEKLSYLVVMPKFDEKSPDRPYIAILTKKPKEFEEQFKGSDFYLALASSLDGAKPVAKDMLGMVSTVVANTAANYYVQVHDDEYMLDPALIADVMKIYSTKTDKIIDDGRFKKLLESLRIMRGSDNLRTIFWDEAKFDYSGIFAQVKGQMLSFIPTPNDGIRQGDSRRLALATGTADIMQKSKASAMDMAAMAANVSGRLKGVHGDKATLQQMETVARRTSGWDGAKLASLVDTVANNFSISRNNVALTQPGVRKTGQPVETSGPQGSRLTNGKAHHQESKVAMELGQKKTIEPGFEAYENVRIYGGVEYDPFERDAKGKVIFEDRAKTKRKLRENTSDFPKYGQVDVRGEVYIFGKEFGFYQDYDEQARVLSFWNDRNMFNPNAFKTFGRTLKGYIDRISSDEILSIGPDASFRKNQIVAAFNGSQGHFLLGNTLLVRPQRDPITGKWVAMPIGKFGKIGKIGSIGADIERDDELNLRGSQSLHLEDPFSRLEGNFWLWNLEPGQSGIRKVVFRDGVPTQPLHTMNAIGVVPIVLNGHSVLDLIQHGNTVLKQGNETDWVAGPNKRMAFTIGGCDWNGNQIIVQLGQKFRYETNAYDVNRAEVSAEHVVRFLIDVLGMKDAGVLGTGGDAANYVESRNIRYEYFYSRPGSTLQTYIEERHYGQPVGEGERLVGDVILVGRLTPPLSFARLASGEEKAEYVAQVLQQMKIDEVMKPKPDGQIDPEPVVGNDKLFSDKPADFLLAAAQALKDQIRTNNIIAADVSTSSREKIRVLTHVAVANLALYQIYGKYLPAEHGAGEDPAAYKQAMNKADEEISREMTKMHGKNIFHALKPTREITQAYEYSAGMRLLLYVGAAQDLVWLYWFLNNDELPTDKPITDPGFLHPMINMTVALTTVDNFLANKNPKPQESEALKTPPPFHIRVSGLDSRAIKVTLISEYTNEAPIERTFIDRLELPDGDADRGKFGPILEVFKQVGVRRVSDLIGKKGVEVTVTMNVPPAIGVGGSQIIEGALMMLLIEALTEKNVTAEDHAAIALAVQGIEQRLGILGGTEDFLGGVLGGVNHAFFFNGMDNLAVDNLASDNGQSSRFLPDLRKDAKINLKSLLDDMVFLYVGGQHKAVNALEGLQTAVYSRNPDFIASYNHLIRLQQKALRIIVGKGTREDLSGHDKYEVTEALKDVMAEMGYVFRILHGAQDDDISMMYEDKDLMEITGFVEFSVSENGKERKVKIARIMPQGAEGRGIIALIPTYGNNGYQAYYKFRYWLTEFKQKIFRFKGGRSFTQTEKVFIPLALPEGGQMKKGDAEIPIQSASVAGAGQASSSAFVRELLAVLMPFEREFLGGSDGAKLASGSAGDKRSEIKDQRPATKLSGAKLAWAIPGGGPSNAIVATSQVDQAVAYIESLGVNFDPRFYHKLEALRTKDRATWTAEDMKVVNDAQKAYEWMSGWIRSSDYYQTLKGHAPILLSMEGIISAMENGQGVNISSFAGGLGVLFGEWTRALAYLGGTTTLKGDTDAPEFMVGIPAYSEGVPASELDADGLPKLGKRYVSSPQSLGLPTIKDGDGVTDTTVELDLPAGLNGIRTKKVKVKFYLARVGPIQVVMPADDQNILNELYFNHTGSHERFEQDWVYGLAMFELRQRLGYPKNAPIHMNETATFAYLIAAIRGYLDETVEVHGVKRSKYTYEQALALVGGQIVFFTHTLVPAGIDYFNEGHVKFGTYIQKYFMQSPNAEVVNRSSSQTHAVSNYVSWMIHGTRTTSGIQLPGFEKTPYMHSTERNSLGRDRGVYFPLQFIVRLAYLFGGQVAAVSQLNAKKAGDFFVEQRILLKADVQRKPVIGITNAVDHLFWSSPRLREELNLAAPNAGDRRLERLLKADDDQADRLQKLVGRDGRIGEKTISDETLLSIYRENRVAAVQEVRSRKKIEYQREIAEIVERESEKSASPGQLLRKNILTQKLARVDRLLDTEGYIYDWSRRLVEYKRMLLLLLGTSLPEFEGVLSNRQEPLSLAEIDDQITYYLNKGMDEGHPYGALTPFVQLVLEKKMQFIFAGKAFDASGRSSVLFLNRFIERMAKSYPEFQDRVVFVEGYDERLSQFLVRAAFWINTPKRPLEASGTSGMKTLLPNVAAVLDGWLAGGASSLNAFVGFTEAFGNLPIDHPDTWPGEMKKSEEENDNVKKYLKKESEELYHILNLSIDMMQQPRGQEQFLRTLRHWQYFTLSVYDIRREFTGGIVPTLNPDQPGGLERGILQLYANAVYTTIQREMQFTAAARLAAANNLPSVNIAIIEPDKARYDKTRKLLWAKLASQMGMTTSQVGARFAFTQVPEVIGARLVAAKAGADILLLDGSGVDGQNAGQVAIDIREFRREAVSRDLKRRRIALDFAVRIAEDLGVSNRAEILASLHNLRRALSAASGSMPHAAVIDVNTGLAESEDMIADALARTFVAQDDTHARQVLDKMADYVLSPQADIESLLFKIRAAIDRMLADEWAKLTDVTESPILATLDKLIVGASEGQTKALIAQYIADKDRIDDLMKKRGIEPKREFFITSDSQLAEELLANVEFDKRFDVLVSPVKLDTVKAVREFLRDRRNIKADQAIGVINLEDRGFDAQSTTTENDYLLEVRMNQAGDSLYGVHPQAVFIVLRGGDRHRRLLMTLSKVLTEALNKVSGQLESIGTAA